MPAVNRRQEERIATALPLSFENGTGVTEDVAATGLFFWTDSTVGFEVGDRVNFTIEIVRSGRQIRPKCQGEIVRVESKGIPTGVAVRIVDSAVDVLQM
jgi:hypothetical protein